MLNNFCGTYGLYLGSATCVYWMEEIYVPQDEIYYVNSCCTQLGEMISQFASLSLFFERLLVLNRIRNFNKLFSKQKNMIFLFVERLFFVKAIRVSSWCAISEGFLYPICE